MADRQIHKYKKEKNILRYIFNALLCLTVYIVPIYILILFCFPSYIEYAPQLFILFNFFSAFLFLISGRQILKNNSHKSPFCQVLNMFYYLCMVFILLFFLTEIPKSIPLLYLPMLIPLCPLVLFLIPHKIPCFKQENLEKQTDEEIRTSYIPTKKQYINLCQYAIIASFYIFFIIITFYSTWCVFFENEYKPSLWGLLPFLLVFAVFLRKKKDHISNFVKNLLAKTNIYHTILYGICYGLITFAWIELEGELRRPIHGRVIEYIRNENEVILHSITLGVALCLFCSLLCFRIIAYKQGTLTCVGFFREIKYGIPYAILMFSIFALSIYIYLRL